MLDPLVYERKLIIPQLRGMILCEQNLKVVPQFESTGHLCRTPWPGVHLPLQLQNPGFVRHCRALRGKARVPGCLFVGRPEYRQECVAHKGFGSKAARPVVSLH